VCGPSRVKVGLGGLAPESRKEVTSKIRYSSVATIGINEDRYALKYGDG
jgi:hypothetical protein